MTRYAIKLLGYVGMGSDFSMFCDVDDNGPKTYDDESTAWVACRDYQSRNPKGTYTVVLYPEECR